MKCLGIIKSDGYATYEYLCAYSHYIQVFNEEVVIMATIFLSPQYVISWQKYQGNVFQNDIPVSI